MAARIRKRGGNGLEAWPGYVDALSTLVMVIIFVLLVFVLAQAFLSSALSGREKALDVLSRQIATLTDMLSLEKSHSADLQLSVSQLTKDMASATTQRDQLTAKLATLQQTVTDTAADRDKLAAAAQDTQLQLQSAQTRLTSAEATTAQQTQEEADAKQQVALLNWQIEQLRSQLSALSEALDIAKTTDAQKDTEIKDLGAKLNVALAAKVEDLQQYRSEFFGRLRQVLAGKQGIDIVGDRFVFQSEVLFPVGSADLTDQGRDRLTTLAATLRQIAPTIPSDIPWILRVDGHADRQPVSGVFASNWELSTQRAVNVVKFLINQGISPKHLAATGFGDNQPLDPADTQAAYARNRRIELRLTDR
jgi:chemotaxis protein MotB